MRVDILTLFPEMFPPVLGHSIIGRAQTLAVTRRNRPDLWAQAELSKEDQ